MSILIQSRVPGLLMVAASLLVMKLNDNTVSTVLHCLLRVVFSSDKASELLLLSTTHFLQVSAFS